MFKMFNQFFAMFASLFSAGNRLASAADHAAAFVEGEAAAFNERAGLERVAKLRELRSTSKQEDYKFLAEEAIAQRNYDDTMSRIAAGKHEVSGTKPNTTAPETVQ